MTAASNVRSINTAFVQTNVSELLELTTGAWQAVEVYNSGTEEVTYLIGAGTDPGPITNRQNGAFIVSPGQSVVEPVNTGGVANHIFVRVVGTATQTISIRGLA